MEIKDYSSWVTTIISLIAFLLINNIWYIFFKKITPKEESPDYGLLFLSFALAIWFVSGLTTKYLTVERLQLEILKSFFSSLNNIFLLLGSSYLEYAPKFIKINKESSFGQITNFIIIAIFTIFVTYIIGNYTSDISLVKLPDFLLSAITVGILGYSIAVTFWKRRLLILAIFSILTLLVILIAQPFIHFFTSNSNDVYFLLIGLCSKVSFIIIICLLAYSWSQENFQTALQKVYKLRDEVNLLKKEVQHKEEMANKDEREAAWQDIAMKAAHKIGNPIEAIQRNNKTLLIRLNEGNIKASREIHSNMSQSIKDAKVVLTEFKSLTKLTEIKPQEYDIVRLIKQAIRSEIDNSGVSFEISIINPKLRVKSVGVISNIAHVISDDSLITPVDKDKIVHCFSELAANSVHFLNKDKKSITVTLEIISEDIPQPLKPDREYLKIIYKDNGTGVTDHSKRNIFNPFVTTYANGSGLGLAIVTRIIELHEGLIFENGVFGEGAQFVIYLPTDLPINQKKSK